MRDSITVFAAKLAKSAGEILRSVRTDGIIVEKKGDFDLITKADREAEVFIKESISKAFPGHRFLAEESAPSLDQPFDFSGPLWVIDPVDGTTNFAHGHYNVGVSIAFSDNGKVQCGVVHCPFLDETFVAEQGKGATLNDRMIRVSQAERLSDALVGTGFPYRRDDLSEVFRHFSCILPRCRDLRRVGAASLDICWVACGRLDRFYESLLPWDMAAAGLIAREAGARTGNYGPQGQQEIPEDLRSLRFMAAAPLLYDELLELLT